MASDQRLIYVDSKGLIAAVSNDSLKGYLRRIWERRQYILKDARLRAFRTHEDMYLGRLWLVLEPLFSALMYGLMFGLILRTSKGIDNFVGFVILGTTFFGMLARGLRGGSGLVQSSQRMASAFNFPRASTVLGVWIKNLYLGLAPAVVGATLAILMQWGKWPGPAIVLTIPFYLLIHLFSLGLLLITARITALLPDFRSIVPVLNRAWFYVSGVFFSIERYVNIPPLRLVMELNPAYRFLEVMRGLIIYNSLPALEETFYLIAWSFLIVVVGFIYFWKAETRYANLK